MEKTLVKNKVKVRRIIYHNPSNNWGVFTYSNDKAIPELTEPEVKVSGNFSNLFEDSEVEISGEVVVHPTYGPQISLSTFKLINTSNTKNGIIEFLTKSSISGIAYANAVKIYKKFGKDSIRIVLNKTEEIKNISGIGAKTYEKVVKSVAKYKEQEELLNFCNELGGIPYSTINELFNAFGKDAVAKLKKNPYELLEDSSLTFKQIDNIAVKLGIASDNDSRLYYGLLYVLRNESSLKGSTGCNFQDLRKVFLKELGLTDLNLYQYILDILVKEQKVKIEFNQVFLSEFYNAEKAIAEYLNFCKTTQINKIYNEEIVEEELNNFKFKLNEQQVKAIRSCLNNKFSIITGQAGCLSGDTIIRYNRASLGRQIKLEDLYKAQNNLYRKHARGWDLNIPTKVRSYIKDLDQIRLNEISAVIYSGKKDVYILTLEDGKFIKATYDHKIMTSNGFKELGKLTTEDEVMVDNVERYKKKNIHSTNKTIDKSFRVGVYHPYARYKVKDKQSKNKYIELHRAIYEAYINNLTLEEYAKCTETELNNLVFINPKEFHIHHKDGNHFNNDISNLEKLSIKDHLTKHGYECYKNIGLNLPEFSKVKSIEYVGLEDTYDISCYENHNFSANNIIVHNCGKSSITKALVQIFNRHREHVILLSPTGKAAKRLSECTNFPAQTIHRFLKVKDKVSDVIPELVDTNTTIIIDEASMVDVLLLDKVIACTQDDTRIILVGDTHQLPSVQAGNILEDIISSNMFNVCTLTDIMRQAENSNIIKYCADVNNGESISPVQTKDFVFLNFNSRDKALETLLKLYEKSVKTFGLQETQVLCAYKLGTLGMKHLNEELKAVVNKEEVNEKFSFSIGDKVKHTKNNYEKNVFNGETGIITDIQLAEDFLSNVDEDTLYVDFGDRIVPYIKSDIQELQLSYASTVHASQGSEYKSVFVVLDNEVSNILLIRKIIYTALSRAKLRCILISTGNCVNTAIHNDFYRERITKLKEFILGDSDEFDFN